MGKKYMISATQLENLKVLAENDDVETIISILNNITNDQVIFETCNDVVKDIAQIKQKFECENKNII